MSNDEINELIKLSRESGKLDVLVDLKEFIESQKEKLDE